MSNFLTAEEARKIMQEPLLKRKQQKLDNILSHIQMKAESGYSYHDVFVDYNFYPEIKKKLKNLGYKVKVKTNLFDSKDVLFFISW